MILSAARDVIVREGHDQLSMRKLADKIEYSPGTIYLHFSGKADLLNALVEESFAKLSEALRKTCQQDPIENLRLGLCAYVDFGLRHPNHYYFAFMVRPPQRGCYRPHDAFDYLRQCVCRCIEAGCFRNVDAESTAQVLWAAAHGLTSLLISRPRFPWASRDELMREMIDNSIRGLQAKA